MKKKKQTPLWKISGNGLPEASYVFGTMHVKDQRAFVYQEIVKEKIDECQVFAAEVNLQEARQNSNILDTKIPGGQKLQDLLSPSVFSRLEKIFSEFVGTPLTFFLDQKPVIIQNFLSEAVLATDMPYHLDQYLWNYAEEQGKTLTGIETLEEQIAILKGLPLDQQVKLLTETVRNFKNFRRQTKSLAALYEMGDIHKLYRAVKKSSRGMRKILLYNRNDIMADRIAALAKEQPTFAAFGAGHLAGEKGVLRFLKLKGFQLTPLQKIGTTDK